MRTSAQLRAVEPLPRVIDVYARISADYDGTTRTLRVRHDATMPKILRAMQECWRLIVLGPEHTTATCRSHLHLVTPRQPMD